MTALNLLGNGQDLTEITPFVPQTLSENIGAGFGDFMYRNRNMPAPFLTEQYYFQERDNKLRENFGVDSPFDLIDTSEIDARYSDFKSLLHIIPFQRVGLMTRLHKEKQDALDAYIMEQRSSGNTQFYGVRTQTEIQEATKEVARFARKELEETQQRSSGFDAAVGGLVGGVAASFTDPINLATLPLGAGAGFSILKTMAFEAGVNIAIEAGQTPSTMKWQNELGFKYGIGEAATDIAFAGVGGAAFSGIARGAAAGFRAVGSKSQRYFDGAADQQGLPVDVQDAFAYSSRVAHIDETMPVSRGFKDEDISVHRSALSETQDAFNNYRQPNLTSADNHFEMSDYDFRAVGELSPRNIERIKSRGSPSAVTIQREAFESRSQADKYIRDIARSESKKRTDFVVDQSRDGSHRVVEVKDDVGFSKNNNGDISEYKSFDAAKKEAKKVKEETGLEAKAVSLNPEKGKAGQKHLVMVGRKLDDADIKRIKKDPEFFNVIENGRASNPTRPDFANLNLVGTPLYDTVIRPDITMDKALQQVDEALDPQVNAAISADFERIIKENPDFTIKDAEGNDVTLAELKEEMAEADKIIEAVKVCGIG